MKRFFLVLVLALLAYSNSFHAAFHFDDFHQLVDNQHMRSLANVPRFFTEPRLASFTSEDKGYRPVTYTTFALNYAFAGYNVFWYHALNFCLHLLCAFLVFLIVRAVLEDAGREHAGEYALLASVLFAVHPVQTNAVTYVSGRAALLASLFCLAGLASFIRFRRRGGYLWGAAAPAAYLLGLLSKEMAVSLPVLMLAYDLLFTLPRSSRPASAARTLAYYAPFAAVLGLYIIVRRALQGVVVTAEIPYGTASYLMSEARALLIYLRLLFFPVNQNVDYNLPATSSVDASTVAAALLVAAALYGLYRLRRADPAASFFGLWFFIALAPESTFIPITDIAVEYRLYLPSAGFIACVCLLALRAPVPFPFGRLAGALVAALLVLLTFNRNAVWATEHTLWSDAARKAPYSARAHSSLAGALMEEKRYAEAVAEFERSLAINPLDPQIALTYNNMGVCYMALDKPVLGAEMFRKVTEFEPGHRSSYVNLGMALLEAGRYSESMEVLKRAETLFPDFPELHKTLSDAYRKQGMLKESLSEMHAAYSYAPMDFDVTIGLAELYELNGLKKEALEQAQSALSLATDEEQKTRAENLLLSFQVKRK